MSAAGARLIPIAADSQNPSAIAFSANAESMLKGMAVSQRHGAGETRLLSTLVTDKNGRPSVQSSGVVATITLVKGSEYKSEADFRRGWIPLAVVSIPDTFPAEKVVYPQLKLRGGTSWVYAHEDANSKWFGSIVRIVGDRIEQESIPVEAGPNDALEPINGARFLWDNGHEDIWGTCGGRCCKMVGTGHPPPQ